MSVCEAFDYRGVFRNEESRTRNYCFYCPLCLRNSELFSGTFLRKSELQIEESNSNFFYTSMNIFSLTSSVLQLYSCQILQHLKRKEMIIRNKIQLIPIKAKRQIYYYLLSGTYFFEFNFSKF
jgi:hypothetical protein